MRTSYFSENLEKGKVLEFLVSLKLHYIQCVNKEQIKEPSFQYTKYSIPKLFGFTIKFFVLLGIHFFFHDICHSFVCIADCHCSNNLKYTCFFFLFLFFFWVFLNAVNFILYMSTMFEEKVCQFIHNLGDMTNNDQSLLTNTKAIYHVSKIVAELHV